MEREVEGTSWSLDVGACKFSGSILGKVDEGYIKALEYFNLTPGACSRQVVVIMGEKAISTNDFGRRRLIHAVCIHLFYNSFPISPFFQLFLHSLNFSLLSAFIGTITY